MSMNATIQHPRRTSLFKYTTDDGKLHYSDIERVICKYADKECSFHFYSNLARKVIDSMFPISMPYVPPKNPYVVFLEEFLCDKNNGDFDHVGLIYAIGPNEERIELNRFFKEDGKEFIEISKEEFEKDKKNRLFQ